MQPNKKSVCFYLNILINGSIIAGEWPGMKNEIKEKG
jgi:hypothetical protein